MKKSLLQELLVKGTFISGTKSARNAGNGTKCAHQICQKAARFLVFSVCHPNGHIQPCPTLVSQWRLLPMAGHLPPNPANHPELQLSASLCSTILLGKMAWAGRGKRRMILRFSPPLFHCETAWQSPDFGSAGCAPSGGWEGRLWSGETLEVSGLSQSFSHSALTPRDPPGFILFCYSTLPMCQVLPGLSAAFFGAVLKAVSSAGFWVAVPPRFPAVLPMPLSVSWLTFCSHPSEAASLILHYSPSFSSPEAPLESFHVFLWETLPSG